LTNNSYFESSATSAKGKWAETAQYFLRIESISGRNITFQTIDVSSGSREAYKFTTTFTPDGEFVLAK
jgi:hypothetical protein